MRLKQEPEKIVDKTYPELRFDLEDFFVKLQEDKMQKKKTFSTMEIVLLGVLVGSLILSFWQGRQEDKEH